MSVSRVNCFQMRTMSSSSFSSSYSSSVDVWVVRERASPSKKTAFGERTTQLPLCKCLDE